MPESSPAANYAFDVTPARLVTGLITERGVCEAPKRVAVLCASEKRLTAYRWPRATPLRCGPVWPQARKSSPPNRSHIVGRKIWSAGTLCMSTGMRSMALSVIMSAPIRPNELASWFGPIRDMYSNDDMSARRPVGLRPRLVRDPADVVGHRRAAVRRSRPRRPSRSACSPTTL